MNDNELKKTFGIPSNEAIAELNNKVDKVTTQQAHVLMSACDRIIAEYEKLGTPSPDARMAHQHAREAMENLKNLSLVNINDYAEAIPPTPVPQGDEEVPPPQAGIALRADSSSTPQTPEEEGRPFVNPAPPKHASPAHRVQTSHADDSTGPITTREVSLVIARSP